MTNHTVAVAICIGAVINISVAVRCYWNAISKTNTLSRSTSQKVGGRGEGVCGECAANTLRGRWCYVMEARAILLLVLVWCSGSQCLVSIVSDPHFHFARPSPAYNLPLLMAVGVLCLCLYPRSRSTCR